MCGCGGLTPTQRVAPEPPYTEDANEETIVTDDDLGVPVPDPFDPSEVDEHDPQAAAEAQ